MPHWLHLRSSSAVLAAGAFKAGLLALLMPAMLHPQLVGGDVQLAFLVAANWWMSGYINTGAYLLAPRLAAQAAAAGRFQRATGSGVAGGSKGSGGGGAASVKARAGGVMALAFQASCFLGLLGAWALQNWLLAGWGPAGDFPASHVSSGSSSSDLDAATAGALAAAVAGGVQQPAGVQQVVAGGGRVAGGDAAAAAVGGAEASLHAALSGEAVNAPAGDLAVH
jgi:hypothetical protein